MKKIFTPVPTICLLFVFATLLFGVPLALAEEGRRQEITVTINKNYTAEGTWSVPTLIVRNPPPIYTHEFKSYGNVASTNYDLKSVVENKKENIVLKAEGDDIFSFYPSAPKKDEYRTYYLNYSLVPLFQEPVAIYEIWISGVSSSARNSPIMHITFPSDWELLTSWPQGSSLSENNITFEYPDTRYETNPVMFIFKTQGRGSVKQVGKYTLSGSPQEVQKIEEALQYLEFVDELMSKNLGIQPPNKIFIVAEDLAKSGRIGFEAEALAAPPNVVVFNDRFTKNKTTEEIAEILAHELLHLAVQNLGLFQDRTYQAPWFDEGLAVYFQTLAHREIYKNKDTKRVLVEELNRTHAVSPQEAEVLYESPFDFLFDGNRRLGTSASYKHAGLLFGQFADKAGVEGFTQLFKILKPLKTKIVGIVHSSSVMDSMVILSGVAQQKQLTHPTLGSATQVAERIGHPENDPDTSAEIVANYIKNDIKHYFAEGGQASKSALTSISAPVNVAANAPVTNTPVVTQESKSKPVLPKTGKISPNLTIGSRGEQVTLLQTFLESKGFLKMPVGVARGNFGGLTKRAVQAFQKNQGIPTTGYVGPKTRTAINAALGQ